MRTAVLCIGSYAIILDWKYSAVPGWRWSEYFTKCWFFRTEHALNGCWHYFKALLGPLRVRTGPKLLLNKQKIRSNQDWLYLLVE